MQQELALLDRPPHHLSDGQAEDAAPDYARRVDELGKMEEARTANERAKWLLRKMPPESFEQGKFSLPKKYWDDWLKWTSDSGMWKKQ